MQCSRCTDIFCLVLHRIFNIPEDSEYLIEFQSFRKIKGCDGKPFFECRTVAVNIVHFFATGF